MSLVSGRRLAEGDPRLQPLMPSGMVHMPSSSNNNSSISGNRNSVSRSSWSNSSSSSSRRSRSSINSGSSNNRSSKTINNSNSRNKTIATYGAAGRGAAGRGAAGRRAAGRGAAFGAIRLAYGGGGYAPASILLFEKEERAWEEWLGGKRSGERRLFWGLFKFTVRNFSKAPVAIRKSCGRMSLGFHHSNKRTFSELSMPQLVSPQHRKLANNYSGRVPVLPDPTLYRALKLILILGIGLKIPACQVTSCLLVWM